MRSTAAARLSRLSVWLGALALALHGLTASALDNGLARTPPMGWNSWNKFGCGVSEQLIREMADALVKSGLRDAGYQYLVIDDCWQASRDAAGNIQADPARFPSGMKALADYVHARGLKFGLYSDAGAFTCQHRPGSRGHETQDAKQYAAWEVDYLKYDWCAAEGQSAPESYRLMRDALAATGRPIVFGICEWGLSKPATWAGPVGNLWRTTADIRDCFDCRSPLSPGPMMGENVLQILDQQAALGSAAGPGHWNDPDMLEVGNGGMSETEYQAHFSLWAMLAAPLIAGNDVRSMDESTRRVLGNREVIAIDQDASGIEAHRLHRDGDADVWARPLADGGYAVALLNRGSTPRDIGFRSAELAANLVGASLRDVWRAQTLAPLGATFNTQVAPHSVALLRIGAPSHR